MLRHVRTLAGILILHCVALTICVNAQTRNPSIEQVNRAVIVFNTVLHDEERAKKHVRFILGYMLRSPWTFELLTGLTQKLAVAGFVVEDVDESMAACGDMALAMDAEDSGPGFAEIVVIVNSLSDEHADVREALDDLQARGVPAYEFLADATGTKTAKVIQLAQQGRLKSVVARRLLLEAFRRKYGGLAAKLTEQQRNAPRN